jgi:hypothetical protein
MIVQAPEFEVTPLRGTASIAVSIGGQQIGLITYETACGWTAMSDDQSRTCETLHEAIDFIKTVWEPGVPPTEPDPGISKPICQALADGFLAAFPRSARR